MRSPLSQPRSRYPSRPGAHCRWKSQSPPLFASPLLARAPESFREPESCLLQVGVGAGLSTGTPASSLKSKPGPGKACSSHSGLWVLPDSCGWSHPGKALPPGRYLPSPKRGCLHLKKKQPLILVISTTIIHLILVISIAESHFAHGKTEAQRGQVACPGLL